MPLADANDLAAGLLAGYLETSMLGEHNFYVWSAYGLAILILAGLWIYSWLKLIQREQALRRHEVTKRVLPKVFQGSVRK